MKLKWYDRKEREEWKVLFVAWLLAKIVVGFPLVVSIKSWVEKVKISNVDLFDKQAFSTLKIKKAQSSNL